MFANKDMTWAGSCGRGPFTGLEDVDEVRPRVLGCGRGPLTGLGVWKRFGHGFGWGFVHVLGCGRRCVSL